MRLVFLPFLLRNYYFVIEMLLWIFYLYFLFKKIYPETVFHKNITEFRVWKLIII